MCSASSDSHRLGALHRSVPDATHTHPGTHAFMHTHACMHACTNTQINVTIFLKKILVSGQLIPKCILSLDTVTLPRVRTIDSEKENKKAS